MRKRRARLLTLLTTGVAIAVVAANCGLSTGGFETRPDRSDMPTPTSTGGTSTGGFETRPDRSDTPTPTSLPGPYIVANLGVRVREGPTIFHKEVGLLKVGDTAKVLGRVAGTDAWLAIEYPSAPSGAGYIFRQYVSVYGDLNAVPVITGFPTLAPPPPTVPVTPSNTAAPTLTNTAGPSPTLTRTPAPATATEGPIRIWADTNNVLYNDPCTWVRWEASGVEGIFLNGEAQAGVNAKYVCPSFPSTTYMLQVVRHDFSIITMSVTITHSGVPAGQNAFATACVATKQADPSAGC